jgi:c-di-GMP-binding flagellar brake protein YcgR
MPPRHKRTSHQTERRGTNRFAIEQVVHYQVLSRKGDREDGWGKTVNISSSGVLFTTTHALEPQRQVELDINWPAKFDNRRAMKLVAWGRVVRSGEDYSVIVIDKYEFRVTDRGLIQSA